MATRKGLVAKIGCFSPKKGDEIDSRRQNRAFFTSKRRRERVSSPKSGIFYFKTVTRTGLVVKIVRFSLENGDENRFRRQNRMFFAQKR
ncbi:hypothetical protein NSS89_18340 [Caldifermentibacillus hisashii]|uniref:hypothetical protein n=1 Tax=Caldifermentibacillus hisashii TaxID=996558 RepID=UPI0031FC9B8C